VKLFQIEEPEGGPTDPTVPGAAIGIDLSGVAAVVATAVGGNAVILDDRDGFEQSLPVAGLDGTDTEWRELIEGSRLRAERALARPVTHAVVVLPATSGPALAANIRAAAEQAGVAVLRLVGPAELAAAEQPALAAAVLAEELLPALGTGSL
jgi:hypothetical protein